MALVNMPSDLTEHFFILFHRRAQSVLEHFSAGFPCPYISTFLDHKNMSPSSKNGGISTPAHRVFHALLNTNASLHGALCELYSQSLTWLHVVRLFQFVSTWTNRPFASVVLSKQTCILHAIGSLNVNSVAMCARSVHA